MSSKAGSSIFWRFWNWRKIFIKIWFFFVFVFWWLKTFVMVEEIVPEITKNICDVNGNSITCSFRLRRCFEFRFVKNLTALSVFRKNQQQQNRSLPLLHYAIGPCNSLPYSSFRLNSVIWFVCFGLMWINIKTISRISVNCRPQLNATQWYDVCLFIFIISVHRTSICVGTMFDEIFV